MCSDLGALLLGLLLDAILLISQGSCILAFHLVFKWVEFRALDALAQATLIFIYSSCLSEDQCML
jgi:hypothetical protein